MVSLVLTVWESSSWHVQSKGTEFQNRTVQSYITFWRLYINRSKYSGSLTNPGPGFSQSSVLDADEPDPAGRPYVGSPGSPQLRRQRRRPVQGNRSDSAALRQQTPRLQEQEQVSWGRREEYFMIREHLHCLWMVRIHNHCEYYIVIQITPLQWNWDCQKHQDNFVFLICTSSQKFNNI